MLVSSSPDPLLLLVLALVFDLAFGDMERVFRYVPHPVVIVGSAISFLDKRLNRATRSDEARRIRGIAVVMALVITAGVLGWVAKKYLVFVHFGWAVEALIIAVLLAQRSLFEHVAAVGRALQSDGLAAGRAAVAKIVGRDPESLDEFGVVRAAIESLFENFSDGVVAPAFWYALLGLPGIFAYKTASTLDSMIGHRSPKYLYFGWAAARFDDLLNWIPARLTGTIVGIAALALPETKGFSALRIMFRDAGKHRSPNAGWPEAAAAGALGLALGGPRRYTGTVIDEPWLGEGKARASVTDIGNALQLYSAAAACLAVLLLAGAAARQYL
jgi:adenosylcobinamide-phosphate synthase